MAKSLQSKLLTANIIETIVSLVINVSLNIYSFRMYKTDVNEVNMSSIKSSGAFVNMVQMKLQSQISLYSPAGTTILPSFLKYTHYYKWSKCLEETRIRHWPAAPLLVHLTVTSFDALLSINKRKFPVHRRNYNKYQNVKSSYISFQYIYWDFMQSTFNIYTLTRLENVLNNNDVHVCFWRTVIIVVYAD